MPSAVRTLGLTVAASLGLHGGLALLAATAMTVLPSWPPGAGRTGGQKLQVARPCKAGDKYLLSASVLHDSPSQSPIMGKMLVALEGLWEVQEVTPNAGQPRRYTFTVTGSNVISGEKAGALFRDGTVISGFINDAGAPAWTVDGAPADAALTSLLRTALPVPAAGDRDRNGESFQPPAPVTTGESWPFNASAVAEHLTADGFRLTNPPAGSVTLSEPVDWQGEIPGRQIQVTVNSHADAVPGLPEGSELKAAVFKNEGELFLPDDSSLPILHEKWVTDAMLVCKLPGMTRLDPVSIMTTVERDYHLVVPDNTEPQEIEVTFVPQEELPVLTSNLPKPANLVEAGPESQPPQPRGPIHIVAKEDMPSVMPFESDTPFISDRNMRASATNAPVAGADPRVGSQEGEELPGLSLFNARHSPAGVSTPPPPPPPAPASPPQPEMADTPPPPKPEPEPVQEPEPPKEDRPPDNATVATDDPNAPAPAPPKPPEMRDKPPDPVKLADTKKPKPPVRPVDPVRPVTKPGAKPVVSSVKTKVEGGLTVRGHDSSVDAKDTPEGRFYSAMHDSIGMIWNMRLASVHGLTGSGVVEVEFDIDINGKVSNVKLVDPGKANPVLEDVCLSAVRGAKIPALPPSLKREIQDPLSGGRLHQKINFYKIPRR